MLRDQPFEAFHDNGSAIGWSLLQEAGDFFGTDINVGMTPWDSKTLNMSTKTSASCSAQSLMAWPGILSGAAWIDFKEGIQS